MPLEPARLTFDPNGTPVSEIYNDIYHSAAGAHSQARHVFLAGNGLPARWQGRDHFVILETGFGLGINFLATWMAWRNDTNRCKTLHFVSVEKYPFTVYDLARAHSAYSEFSPITENLYQHWPPLLMGEHRLELDEGRILLTLIFGNAVETLPALHITANAFYLDGFSPDRNPELWSPELCCSLARLAGPDATLATWSVAGNVRRALTVARFKVEKRPGFLGKRQMLVGSFPRANFTENL